MATRYSTIPTWWRFATGLLAMVAVDCSTNPYNTLNYSATYPTKADFLLGALFPIHMAPIPGKDFCGQLKKEEGLLPLESLLFAVDQINEDSSLLPGIRIGIVALDSCDSPDVALQQTLQFIKGFIATNNVHHDNEFVCSDGSSPHYKEGQYDKVVGVIGGQQSSVSIQIANVLRLFKVPQISYRSTSTSLSQRNRYPYFLRTVPTDINQVEVILKVLESLHISYASLVYSASEYGAGGMEELERKSANSSVCFATPTLPVKASDPDEAFDHVVLKLMSNTKAKAVVLFADADVAIKIFKAVRRKKGSFMWIGSEGWTFPSDALQEFSDVIEGSIGVQPMAGILPGFREHFTSLKPWNNTRNPWFTEYWQSYFNCSLAVDPFCRERLFRKDNFIEPQWLHFVRDSIYAFAHGLHNMWAALCNRKRGPCAAMTHQGHIHGEELCEFIRNATFRDVTNHTFRFQESGAGIPRYTVFIYRKTTINNSHWIPIANFSYISEIPIYKQTAAKSHVYWRTDNRAFPQSFCGIECQPGEAKIPRQDKCCWHCEKCTSNQYLNVTTRFCNNCHACDRKDASGVKCVRKQERFLDYRNQWAITSMAFSGIGIFSTIFIGIIFWVHIETPVIKAASRELSYILLAGIFLSFLMTFAILAPPTKVSCGLTRFFLGFSYTVCYSAILTKTSRISRIFNKNPAKPHKAKYTSPKSQMVIVLLLVCVEVIINVSWLSYYQPEVELDCYNGEGLYNIRLCKGMSDHSYIVGFIYPLFLVLLCTIYAIKTRKCPGGFNEARFIAFTNYTTCIIWLIFVPLYLTTAKQEAVRIVSLALSLSLGGFVQLGCLFLPKIHIVLFKPEKNTRDAVMSQQKVTSYTSSHNRMQHQSSPSMLYINGSGSSPYTISGSQSSSTRSTAYIYDAQGRQSTDGVKNHVETPKDSTNNPNEASKYYSLEKCIQEI